MKNKYVLELLKEDLKGEYDAINMYDNHITKIDNIEIKEMLIHIRDEEKEHVEELTELISKYNNTIVSRLKFNYNI